MSFPSQRLKSKINAYGCKTNVSSLEDQNLFPLFPLGSLFHSSDSSFNILVVFIHDYVVSLVNKRELEWGASLKSNNLFWNSKLWFCGSFPKTTKWRDHTQHNTVLLFSCMKIQRGTIKRNSTTQVSTQQETFVVELCRAVIVVRTIVRKADNVRVVDHRKWREMYVWRPRSFSFCKNLVCRNEFLNRQCTFKYTQENNNCVITNNTLAVYV